MRIGIALLCLTAILAAGLSAQAWVKKISGPGLGNPLAVNPLNQDVLYAAAGGNRVFVSRDRGYNWANYGALVTGGGIVKSVSVNPADTLQMLVGMESSVGFPDRIMRSSDGGLTWTETWSGSFSYYGQPVEFSASHPDTVYTMGLDTVYRSIDFGLTWDTVCTGRGFNAWCDASLRPDSAAVMYAGDNLSGIWKTADHGSSWRKVYATLGEIPSIAIDPLNPRVAYASKFGGGGGMVKSTDWGETWHNITVPSGNLDTWWVTCSPVHPGYVYYGTYFGDTSKLGIYFSRDSGDNWSKINDGLMPGSHFNYGLLTLDSLTLLALQSNGIHKYQYPTGIDVLQPDGGEVWLGDSQYAITWSSTGLYRVRLEYSTDNGASWNVIADSVPASQASYLWATPPTISESCLVRISDALFTSTAGTSESLFTLTDAYLTVKSPDGGEALDAGSGATIFWIAFSLDSVTIEYSTDGGAGWTYVTEAPADAGAFDWTVPDVTTQTGLVRIRGVDDTSIVDVSDSTFSILSPAEFTGWLLVTDGGSGADTLSFGNLAAATDSIDVGLGESELPAVPPGGTFDARWDLAGTNGVRRDYRDTLAGPADEHRYRARAQPGPDGYPLTLSWDPESLRAGTIVIRDLATGGDRLNANMRRDSTLLVPDQSVGDLEVLQCPGSVVTIPGNGAWVLMSLPVETGDRRADRLFPFSPGGAYGYRNGYLRRDTLRHGEGYWIRTEQATLTGCPVTAETIAVQKGWNIIGALTAATPVATILSVPESLVTSPYYGYTPSGYQISDSLAPGGGYWVKCLDSGSLIITQAVVARSEAAAHGSRGSISHSLNVGIGSGVSTLYFGARGEVGTLDAPPAPPGQEGGHSFKNAKIGVFHSDSLNYPVEYEIVLKNGESEINFSWNVEIQDFFDYILIERVGTQEVSKVPLKGGGKAGYSHTSYSKFFLRVQPRGIGNGGIPAGFSMGQCYPNPFNPSTRVAIALPSESIVSVTVYNVLGEVVSKGTVRQYSAGDHVFEWSARGDDGMPLGSGVYFIALTAVPEPGAGEQIQRTFSTVRKAALIR